jgi:hypothetical protein
MEFEPRPLGKRSMLGNARNVEIKNKLIQKIKGSFRFCMGKVWWGQQPKGGQGHAQHQAL